MKSINPSAVSRQEKSRRKAPRARFLETILVPVLLKRGDEELGLFHVPLCSICREPIIDFEAGNLITFGLGNAKPIESLGKVGDTEFLRLPGKGLPVCFSCDRSEFKPWNRLSSIFSRDQRHPAQKMGFEVAPKEAA